MTLDFNNAGEQMKDFEPLPDGTLCLIGWTVKPGGAGADGSLTPAKPKADGTVTGNIMLVAEGTIISAPNKGRKIFASWVVEGPSDQAINISRATIRAMLNSARGLNPKDNSPAAAAGRVLNSYGEIHGMVTAARLRFVPATEKYKAKNDIACILEPGDLNYREVMAGQTIMPQGAATANPGSAVTHGGWQPPAAQQPAAQPAQQQAQQWTPPAPGQPAQGNPGTQPVAQPAAQPQEQPSAAPNWVMPAN